MRIKYELSILHSLKDHPFAYLGSHYGEIKSKMLLYFESYTQNNLLTFSKKCGSSLYIKLYCITQIAQFLIFPKSIDLMPFDLYPRNILIAKNYCKIIGFDDARKR